MADNLLTTAQAAKRLRRSRRWVQNIILRGQLKAERIGSVYVVRLEDVKNYRHQSPGRPNVGTPPPESPRRSGKVSAGGPKRVLAEQAERQQNNGRHGAGGG